MPEENKRKYAHWLRPGTVKLAEEMYHRDNCASRSEYVEKAIRFYTGYISEKDSSLFLSDSLTSTLRGMLTDTENRMATLIFKLTVELAIMMNVLDNDRAGLETAARITEKLRQAGYSDVYRLLSCSKDWSEDLQAERGITNLGPGLK